MNWGDFRNMVNMNEITLPGLPRYDPGWVDEYGTPINNAPWPAIGPMFVHDDGLVRVTATIVPGNAPVSHLLTAATTFGGKVIVGRDLMQIGVGQPRGRK